MTTPLYKKLKRTGVSPHDDIDKILVGGLQNQVAELISQVNRMIDGNEPSQVRIILGGNGNGKTILNYYLQNRL